jgi:hypothetical protein
MMWKNGRAGVKANALRVKSTLYDAKLGKQVVKAVDL